MPVLQLLFPTAVVVLLTVTLGMAVGQVVYPSWNTSQVPYPVLNFYQVWFDASRNRPVPVLFYYPNTIGRPTAPIRFAAMLFSHGLGGNSNNSSPYWGRSLAAGGRISAHIQHIGSDSSVPSSDLAAAANAANLILRTQDCAFAFAQLERIASMTAAEHPLGGRIEATQLGIAGHSFGATTTQSVIGIKLLPSGLVISPQAKVAVIMSPWPQSPENSTSYTDVRVPVMTLTGTRDESSIRESLVPSDRLKVYQNLLANQRVQTDLVSVNYFGGEHKDFGAPNVTMGTSIVALGTAFLDASFDDNAEARGFVMVLAQTNRSVAEYLFRIAPPYNAMIRPSSRTASCDGLGNQYVSGFVQTTSINQDAIVTTFTNNRSQAWRVMYDTTAVDSRSILTMVDPMQNVWVVFTVDGGSTDPGYITKLAAASDAFTKTVAGSYGSGGGPKIPIIARINATSGLIIKGMFLPAILPSGKTNTVNALRVGWNPVLQTVSLDCTTTAYPVGAGSTVKAMADVTDADRISGAFVVTYELNVNLTRIVEARLTRNGTSAAVNATPTPTAMGSPTTMPPTGSPPGPGSSTSSLAPSSPTSRPSSRSVALPWCVCSFVALLAISIA